MNRILRKHRAMVDQYHAGTNKPPTRKQAKAWLAPIRSAFNQMLTGEIDAHRGYAITRIHHADEDFARVDFAINGFLALLQRVMPDFDTTSMKKVSKKLESGVLMTAKEIEDCFIILNECENNLIKITRADLKHAAQVEQVSIELERLNLKAAA